MKVINVLFFLNSSIFIKHTFVFLNLLGGRNPKHQVRPWSRNSVFELGIWIYHHLGRILGSMPSFILWESQLLYILSHLIDATKLCFKRNCSKSLAWISLYQVKLLPSSLFRLILYSHSWVFGYSGICPS